MSDPQRLERLLRTATEALATARQRTRALELRLREPIAIVGVGLRLPGEVTDLQSLHRLLVDRVDTVRRIPPERFEVPYDPDPGATGKSYVRHASLLDDVTAFDAAHFGISPKEAVALDPQHRLLLEAAWHALEDARVPPLSLRDTRTGVYVGIGPDEYQQHRGRGPEEADAYDLTGSHTSFAAGRVAYHLGLQGPAVAIDTACSSSLVAVHLATSALRRGECELALAGGVQVIADPESLVLLSRTRAASPDGRCKTFSSAADGYGRGEGVGLLVLARLSTATERGMRVLGLIRGSAVNHDGASSGITAPNGTSQQAVLRAALADASLAPADVDVVECHGTGTRLGDPIEVQALAAVYGDASRRLKLLALKTHLGHLEAAAGVAGILEVLASFRAGVLPPTLHTTPRNPHIPWDELPVDVVDQPTPWLGRPDRPRRAGVSAFGLSGTNAHLLLEEAPAEESGRPPTDRPVPLLLSARTPAGVVAQAARLATAQVHPVDFAATLARARTPLAARAAVVVRPGDDVASALRSVRAPPRRSGRVVALFTGQGSQRPGMARKAWFAYPVFRQALDAVLDAVGREAPGVELRGGLLADDEAIHRTELAQPALFALEVALFRLWEHLGVRFDALLGHSVGELAAAHVAGVWSLEDAVKLVVARGRLMQACRADGAMASLRASEAEVRAALVPGVDVAAVNATDQVVISGDADAVRTVAARFDHTPLTVSHAFHSHHLDGMLDAFRSVAASLTYHEPTVALAGRPTDPEYWVRQVRDPVRFHDALVALGEVRAFVECGPHGVLAALAAVVHPGAAAAPTLRKGDDAVPDAVAALWEAGVDLDLAAVVPDGRLVDLPGTGFEPEVFWLPPRARSGTSLAGAGPLGRWPLAGRQLRLPGGGFVHLFDLGPGLQPYLADHLVYGRIVVPGAMHVAILTSVGATLWPDRAFALEEVQFVEALQFVDPAGTASMMVHLQPGADGAFHATTAGFADGLWTTHAVAVLRPVEAPRTAPLAVDPAVRDALPATGTDHLAVLDGMNIGWEPMWRWMRSAGPIPVAAHPSSDAGTRSPGGFLGRFEAPDGVPAWDAPIPGGLLDNAFALPLFGGDPRYTDDTTPRIPFRVDRLVWHGGARPVRWVASQPRSVTSHTATSDLQLYDDLGAPLATVEGFTAHKAQRSRFLRDAPARHLYRLVEVAVAAVEPGPAPLVVRWPAGEPTAASALELATQGLRWLQAASGETSRVVWVVPEGSPAAATLVGLARAARAERPDLRLVVVEGSVDEATLRALPPDERDLVVRDGSIAALRLARVDAADARPWGPGEGAVVVTGGLGGLGATVARHLVTERGVRRLILLSRRGADSPGATELLAELAATGAAVTAAGCDVADPDALAGALAGVPIAAAFHAAGAVDDALIDGVTPDRLAAGFRAKVDGAWALHRVLPADAHLVLFSSLAATLGSAGQSAYAAANAALDGFARWRSAQGGPTTSLAWGPWAEVGMAARLDPGLVERIRRSGLIPMTPEQGLALLDEALGRPDPVLIPVHLDRTTLTDHPSPLVTDLVKRRRSAAESAAEGTAFADQLARLPASERERVATHLVRTELAGALGLKGPEDVPPTEPLQALGLDSLLAVDARTRLAQVVGRPLPATLLFDYPTAREIGAFLLDSLGLPDAVVAAAPEVEVAPRDDEDPIAIVGMACRLPGGVAAPEDLWRLLLDGTDAIGPLPTDRGWDLDGLVHPDFDHPGTSVTGEGGFIADPASFDAGFFGISPREAPTVDPQHRLLLETAWEALERARIAPHTVSETATGVYVGLIYDDYRELGLGTDGSLDGYLATGTAHSVAAGRIAYTLGLQGPALTLDTACSSSLVALHLAAESIRRGECDRALVCGATVYATPKAFVWFSRLRTLSPTGRSRAFSDEADGAAWAEGVGVLVVERLSVARRLGHPVVALVRGTAVNQDGRSQGLTAPNGPAQQRVIRAALADAGVSAAEVDLVEAHGTGTPLGDPIEAQALAATYGRARGPGDPPVSLGSVKTNVGHTQAAAGVTGVIKVALALGHGVLPRTLHAEKPSSHVVWEGSHLRLQTATEPWERRGHPRRGAVSSFGFSGTNAHVVLEEAPVAVEAPEPPVRPVPLLLSGRSAAQVRDVAAGLAGLSACNPVDLARSLRTTRSPLPWRAGVVWAPGQSLDAALAAVEPVATRPGRLVALFTGQGSQRPGMAREAYARWDGFREALDRVLAAFDAEGVDLRPALLGEDEAIHRTEVAQPALFALQVAQFGFWRSLGLIPDALLGHSVGELAAAHVAGLWSLADAVRVVLARGRLMQACRSDGAMASLRASEAEVRAALVDGVSIAAINAADQVVVSGDADAVAQVAARFESTRLQVSHAFHSHHLDAMLDPFRSVLRSVRFDAPTLNLPPGMRDPEWWVRQVREPVRFADALAGAGEVAAFVECGPHGVLSGFAAAIHPRAVLAPTGRRGEDAIAPAMVALWSAGFDLLPPRAKGEETPGDPAFPEGRLLDLPTTPFQRERYWLPKAPRAAADPLDGLLYDEAWTLAPRVATGLAGRWRVEVGGAVGERLVAAMRAAGAEVVEGPTAAGPEAVASSSEPRGAVVEVGSAAEALSALQRHDGAVWLVTRGAVAAAPGDVVAEPLAEAAWGLGRVAALERPRAFGGLVDLPVGAVGDGLIEALVASLSDGEDQVALRPSGRFVRRLVRASPRAHGALALRGTALVTGGSGALAAHLAPWLLARGAERVVLVSRRGANPDLAADPRIVHAAVDVADRAALDAVIAATTDLRVVVHAAGIGSRGALAELSPSALAEAMSAKATGALQLHEAVAGQALDHFVLFGSIAGFWGSGGQAAYAAANAALDGLARYRRGRGLPAIVLHFGPWSGAGMASEGAAALARLGVTALPPDLALIGLERALARDRTSLAVVDVDWEAFAPAFAAARARPLLDQVAPPKPTVEPASSSGVAPSLVALPAAARRAHAVQVVAAATAGVLGHADPAALDPRAGFFDLGLDSLMAVELRGRLQQALGIAVPTTIVFDRPSVADVADWVVAQLGEVAAVAPTTAPRDAREPIAIVGVGLRLPGGADDLDALWEVVATGVDTVRPIPADRFVLPYDPDPDARGTSVVRHASLLDDVAGFDAGFFGISPREAAPLDPQHRLLLEAAWTALEDAGIAPGALRGTTTGVFVGVGPDEYARHRGHALADADAYDLTGSHPSFASGRLAYHLGLQGPALGVDTACSSSLVAMSLAVDALRRGGCDVALAGGVQVIADPEAFVLLSRTRAVSPDGRCKTFAAAADGYGRGEGVGVLALMRLSDAAARGLRVHGVIRGAAVNHDGASSGITAPNGTAQQRVLRAALADAAVEPAAVDVVQCHGTGTALGDPIEVGALAAVYGAGRDRPLRLGAVKSSLGHLEAAAGVAGVLGVLAAFRHQALPPTRNSTPRNPHIPWSELPVAVVDEVVAWPRRADRPRLAGVSGFGLSGTNAHLVLEEPPVEAGAAVGDDRVVPLVVSGRTVAAVRAQAERWAAFVETRRPRLVDLAFTAATARTPQAHRVVLRSADLAAALRQLADGASVGVASPSHRPGGVAVLFTGQGSQRVGMGLGLYGRYPAYTGAFDEALAAFEGRLPGSLRAVLEGRSPGLDDTAWTQPALFVVEVALYRQWEAWGLRPDALLGHSIGEVVAAHVAGALDLGDAAELVAARGRLMQACRSDGAMASIEADEAAIALPPGVSVAAVNAPGRVVVSGDAAGVEALVARHGGQRLTVSHAFHSAHLDPMLDPFREVVADLRFSSPRIPVIANRTGEVATDLGDPEHWVAQVRHAVRFADGLRALRARGVTTFVECGPGGVLSALGPLTVPEGAVFVPSLRRDRDEPEALEEALAAAVAAGWEPAWEAVFDGTGARRIELPTTVFQHERYWLPVRETAGRAALDGATTGGWALAGRRLPLPGGGFVFHVDVGPGVQGYLADHVVFDRIVVPGAFHAAVLLSAAASCWPGEPVELTDVAFVEALTFADPADRVPVMVDLRPRDDGGFDASLAAFRDASWTVHARARLARADRPEGAVLADPGGASPDLDLLGAVGIRWEPRWRWLAAAARVDGAHVGRLVAPAEVPRDDAPIPAGLLDNAFALPILGLAAPDDAVPKLPFRLDRLVWDGQGSIARARVSDVVHTDVHTAANLTFHGADGRVVARVDGFLGHRAPPERFLRGAAPRDLYQLDAVAIGGPTWSAADGSRLGPGDPIGPGTVVVAWPEPKDGDDVAAATADALGWLVRWWRDAPATRVVWVTRGARSLAHAAIAAVGRTAQVERPDRSLVLVDHEDGALDGVLAALPVGEPVVVARGGRAVVPRLASVAATAVAAPTDRPATALITGGTGALGEVVARHLVVAHGVRHLVLLSRSGAAAPGARALTDALREAGAATVALVAGDVADDAVVARALAAAPADHPVGLVVHAAGVLDDGWIPDLAVGERLDGVIRPKVGGALALDRALGPDARLVLFSSLAGVTGNPGQAVYAAANAALDALAARREASGRPTVSLAWGPWARVGMAARTGSAGRPLRNGLVALAPERATQLLDQALARPEPRLVPVGLDRAALQRLADERPDDLPAAWRGLVRVARAAAPTPRAATPRDRDQALREVRGLLGGVLGLPDATDVPVDRPLTELGLDSLMAIEVRDRLERAFDRKLPATLLFDHPTARALAEVLAPEEAVVAPTAPRVDDEADPVVIVGMACRFPGGVTTPEELWSLLDRGGDAIGGFPARAGWGPELYDPDPDAAGHSTSRGGGFLHDADQFDAGFFRIRPREADAIDPQQRLLLETSWEALERSRIAPDRLDGSDTGVFVGVMYGDYGTRLAAFPELLDGDVLTGSAGSTASGRIAYTLGLQGPAMTVDTACSSSLVALHLARRALLDGECGLALVGGVTVMTTPGAFISFSRQRGISPDGRCRAFAAEADGVGWGEGCAMLVVERLSTARRAGRPVLAVVRGSAVNQDGRSQGMSAPNGAAQARVIRAALADAGWSPGDVDAVEAHGTGTRLGDPIEAGALLAVYGDRDRPLYLGSVKSNLGHTQAAAGAAGVIKLVLALRHETLPRTLHADRPNPHVDWSGGLALLHRPVAWPRGVRPRRAGVSSFGISGTNAHLLLEEPPIVVGQPAPAPRPAALLLSAHTATALRAWAGRLARGAAELDPIDLARSVRATRAAGAVRAAVVVRPGDDVATALRAVFPHKGRGGRVVALFTGQGSQRPGMAREAWDRHPAFREALDEVLSAFDADGVDLRPALLGADEAIHRTELAQPALFALQVAQFRLWRRLGLGFDALLGHSIGELAAAHVAGVWSLADAVRMVVARGRLMQACRSDGAMASLRASEAEVRAALVPGVEIAAVNAADQVVVSGDADGVARVSARFAATRLVVSHAFHSHHVDAMLDGFAAVARSVAYHEPSVPMGGRPTDPAWWVAQVRQPVRFHDALVGLGEVAAFVECGPHPVLCALAAAVAPRAALAPSGRKGGDALPEAMATLWEAGFDLDGDVAWPDGRLVDLPTAVFERRRHWIELPVATRAAKAPERREELLYSEVWRAVTTPDPAPAGSWTVVVEPGAAVDVLVGALRSGGGEVRVVERPGGDLAARRAAFAALRLAGPVVVVVDDEADAAGLAAPEGLVTALAALQAVVGGEGAVGARLASVAAAGGRLPGRLWLATTREGPVRDLVGGLVRAARGEFPERVGPAMRLEPGASPEAVLGALGLVDEPELRVGADVAGRRFARAERVVARPAATGPALITGGTGGLAEHVATWLVDHGATDLVLLGRRGPDAPGATARADALRARGARVELVACDVTDRDALAAVLARLAAEGRSPRRVYHLAGSTAGAVLSRATATEVRQALGAKWLGARHLAELLDPRALDELVLFSSLTAHLGLAGEALYSAANAGLDGLASRLAARGWPVRSVAWGPWGGAGMGENPELQRRIAAHGFTPLRPSEAVGVLGLDTGDVVPLVVDVDWDALGRARPTPLLAELADLRAGSERSGLPDLAGLDPEAARAVLVAWLRGLAARVLGSELDDRVDGLAELGLDSLGLLDLRTAVADASGVALYAQDLVQAGTLANLAELLRAELGRGSTPASRAPAPAAAPADVALPPVRDRIDPAATGAPPPPVFVLSAPRSGSTLLRAMLAGHPALFAPPELNLLPFATLEQRAAALADTGLDTGLVQAFVELGDDREVAEARCRTGEAGAVFHELLRRARPLSVVEKSPMNAQDDDSLARALAWAPDARFVHLVRHPGAVVESFARMRMHRVLGREVDDPVAVGEEVWRGYNARIEALLERIPADRQLRVTYEELVRAPEATLRRILGWLGLPWDPRALAPYAAGRLTEGLGGRGDQVGDPNFRKRGAIDPSLADAWRTHAPTLSPATLALAGRLGVLDAEEQPGTVASDVPLATVAWGPTPPRVVLVHGARDQALVWRPVGRSLARREVGSLAFDRRGHALSAHDPQGVYTLLGELRDLRAVVGAGRPVLVAHSFGALLALAFVAARPDAVSGLILVDPPLEPVLRRATATLGDTLRTALDPAPAPAAAPAVPSLDAAAERLRAANPALDPGLARDLAARSFVERPDGFHPRSDPRLGSPVGGLEVFASLDRLLGTLHEHHVRTIALFATRSEHTTPGCRALLTAHHPEARVVEVDGGHHLQLDASEVVADAARELLEGA